MVIIRREKVELFGSYQLEEHKYKNNTKFPWCVCLLWTSIQSLLKASQERWATHFFIIQVH